MTDPSNFVNQHADRWTIPESMVEYEKKIAALEQRFNALSTKFSALVEENATLRKRLEPIEEWWDRNCSEYIRKKHKKWDASMYEAIEKAMELKEGE